MIFLYSVSSLLLFSRWFLSLYSLSLLPPHRLSRLNYRQLSLAERSAVCGQRSLACDEEQPHVANESNAWRKKADMNEHERMQKKVHEYSQQRWFRKARNEKWRGCNANLT